MTGANIPAELFPTTSTSSPECNSGRASWRSTEIPNLPSEKKKEFFQPESTSTLPRTCTCQPSFAWSEDNARTCFAVVRTGISSANDLEETKKSDPTARAAVRTIAIVVIYFIRKKFRPSEEFPAPNQGEGAHVALAAGLDQGAYS